MEGAIFVARWVCRGREPINLDKPCSTHLCDVHFVRVVVKFLAVTADICTFVAAKELELGAAGVRGFSAVAQAWRIGLLSSLLHRYRTHRMVFVEAVCRARIADSG